MAEGPWDATALAKLAGLRRGGPTFPTTRWSLVLAAGQASEQALHELFAAYWAPAYGFARRCGDDPEQAADLVQDLFADLLERGDLERADPTRGRFRSWLLGALKNKRKNRWAHRSAGKRGGGVMPVSLEDAEQVYAIAGSDASPEELYDRMWAARVLAQARARVLEDARPLVVDLAPLLEERPVPTYAELAERHGTSVGAVKVAAHRLKERFRVAIDAVLAETISDPALLGAEKGALGL